MPGHYRRFKWTICHGSYVHMNLGNERQKCTVGFQKKENRLKYKKMTKIDGKKKKKDRISKDMNELRR